MAWPIILFFSLKPIGLSSTTQLTFQAQVYYDFRNQASVMKYVLTQPLGLISQIHSLETRETREIMTTRLLPISPSIDDLLVIPQKNFAD